MWPLCRILGNTGSRVVATHVLWSCSTVNCLSLLGIHLAAYVILSSSQSRKSISLVTVMVHSSPMRCRDASLKNSTLSMEFHVQVARANVGLCHVQTGQLLEYAWL